MTWGLWNSLGVALVLIGTLLLFRYGAPFEVARSSGHQTLVAKTDDWEKHAAEGRRAAFFQWGAVLVITLGSILQVIVSLKTM